MRTSNLHVIMTTALLFVFMLSACGGGQPAAQPTGVSAVEATVEVAVEPTEEPTAAPTATPEIEPEVVDLGNGVSLLLYNLPNDVTLDANLDPNFKDNIPPTKNFDHVYTDTVIVTMTQNGEPVVLEGRIVELCFNITEPTNPDAAPKPYYWDTSKSPLVDGRGTRILSNKDNKICTVVQNSGAYAIVVY